MKKSIITFCLALITVMGLHAESFTGTIVVQVGQLTRTQTVTVTATQNDNGLNTLVLEVPVFGTMTMTDVPSATSGDITVYSAEQYVYSATYDRNLRTILFARTINGMMAADVTLPDQEATMWFNTVGDHFQLPNSDFEGWAASTGEPDRWHGFKSASGDFAGTSANLATLSSSDDVRTGATGHSAVMKAGSFIGIVANGTMTNGQLIAGSMSATSTDNHAEMDKGKIDTDANGDPFYMSLYAKPDKFNVWLKYTQGTANNDNKANVSVKTFDGSYYQEPVDHVYTNLTGSIVGGQIPAGGWTHYSFPFDYDSYAGNNAATEAIFVTFSTNGNPGQGSKNDALYVDDIELVYLAEMTDLRYQGVTIEGWNPAVTTYTMELANEPMLDDFTTDVTGASAVITKSMEQCEDGTYRIAISAVPGDLQTATCYIINVTVNSGSRLGDVNEDGQIDVSDVTALIAYVLGNPNANINTGNADINADHRIDVSDVTALIAMILG